MSLPDFDINRSSLLWRNTKRTMRSVAILFAIVGILVLLGTGTHSVCCRYSLTLTYTLGVGSCGDVGGHSKGNACEVTICGDGRARVGTYCGRGSCNIFGCACTNGCIPGNWTLDFIEKNSNRKIAVTEAKS